ncbi:AraC family transcriptional regulator [Microbacterium lushaniae]|nr:AraC family transcriptional regulator [Microbacterium lushaniae]KAA9156806.1 AraC family transcriptional regulator [Microbacterium lushaniae]
MIDPTRGVLFPHQLPRFTRLAPDPEASELIAWLWIPQWNLAPGVESHQSLLAYPAANIVVEPMEVRLWGATTRASERVLRGSGWAVGAVLRPAALMKLSEAPAELVDGFVEVCAPDLHEAVAAAMPDEQAAANALSRWLIARVGKTTAEGRLANEMSDLLLSDSRILRVEEASRRMLVSTRTFQRLTRRTVGVSPAAMIRRRRLQEAAQRVREGPAGSLAEVAAELGYADHAHLAADFRAELGLTASEYHRIIRSISDSVAWRLPADAPRRARSGM